MARIADESHEHRCLTAGARRPFSTQRATHCRCDSEISSTHTCASIRCSCAPFAYFGCFSPVAIFAPFSPHPFSMFPAPRSPVSSQTFAPHCFISFYFYSPPILSISQPPVLSSPFYCATLFLHPPSPSFPRVYMLFYVYNPFALLSNLPTRSSAVEKQTAACRPAPSFDLYP